MGNPPLRANDAQVSAVQKIARVMPIKPGMKLYRGLGGTVSLPISFYHTDSNGCRGFAEWGFMSTTSKREVRCNFYRRRRMIDFGQNVATFTSLPFLSVP
jgi:hypothetical protein